MSKGLTYTGPGTLNGVPAEDLDETTITRLAWVRLGPERPPSPSDLKPADVSRFRDGLLATGFYAKPKESAS